MAIIEAYGLAISTSEALAKGAAEHGGKGLSDVVTEAFARSNIEIGAHGLAEAFVIGLGHLIQHVKITNVEAINSTQVRFTFDRPMLKDAALLATFNYTITPITPGAVTVMVNSIEPESNTPTPEYVDAITSEMTDSATYEGIVSTTGPTDLEGTYADPANNSAQYPGIGVAPNVSQVISYGENRADVVFTETMKDTPEIKDPANYTWDNGLTTLNVLELDGAIVRLVTDDQQPGLMYTLTVVP